MWVSSVFAVSLSCIFSCGTGYPIFSTHCRGIYQLRKIPWKVWCALQFIFIVPCHYVFLIVYTECLPSKCRVLFQIWRQFLIMVQSILFYTGPSCLFCGWWLSRRHPIISVLIMQVADSLLHDESSNLETLMFCSQTLRSKVKHAYIDALCYFLLSRNLLISVTLNDLSWICLHFRCKGILRSYRQKLFDHCKTLYM